MRENKNPSLSALKYFEQEYASFGANAQRKFPNEELCRFLGRNFFHLPFEERKNIKILEVGCGSGGNLWAIAREGFSGFGVDISPKAIELCQETLASYGCSAELFVTDMINLPIENEALNAVVDVFSSHCLTREQGKSFLLEINRVLRRGGTFFSYFPSKNSDTWKIEIGSEGNNEVFIDPDTLNGLQRPTGPFYGNVHPFRFLNPKQYGSLIENFGFSVSRCETLDRSYYNQTEMFQFIVIEAIKL